MTVELRSRQAAAGIHAAVAQVEPRALSARRRFLGRRGLMAVILAILTPPAGVAVVNSIRGDDDDRRASQRIVDDSRGVEDDDGQVPPRDSADRTSDAGIAAERGAPTAVKPGGADQARNTSPAAASAGAASLELTGRLAFTTMDEPVDVHGNDCSGPCFYYNPSDIHTLDLRSGKTAPLAASPLFEQGSSWSPDGSRLAYSVARGDATATLRTIRADGTDDRQIVSVEGKLALQPTWSPDGRTLAFTLQNRDTPYGMTCCPEIWMVDADGSNLHRVDQITNTDSTPSNPAWSPDGRYLAFERQDIPCVPCEQPETWVLDLETRRLEYFADGAQPAWSPDGKRMAVRNRASVNVIDVASGDRTFISRPGQHLGEPTWSPDGTWIAFTSRDSATWGKRSIWVARSNGESMSAIIDGDKDYWAPSWVR